jgi:hypothetical protein
MEGSVQGFTQKWGGFVFAPTGDGQKETPGFYTASPSRSPIEGIR